MLKNAAQIKNLLEDLYAKYNYRQFIPPDPLQWVYKYKSKADKEIVAFFASALAYGRVEQINRSLEKLFAVMGKNPAAYVLDFNTRRRKDLADFKHRFNTGDDIADLIPILQKVLRQNDSIEKFFLHGYSKTDNDIIPALTKFCSSLTNSRHSRGVQYLLVNPESGSVCKRLNMFLRWMVRKDDVDPGLWKGIDKKKLIVPVDVHIGRLTRILGFHKSKNLNLQTARRITAGFAEIIPDDPVKYDFALSRIGIVEHCTGKLRDSCRVCTLFKFCSTR